MPTIAVADLQLYYQGAGQGEGVVLVHGTGGNADVWGPAQSHLAGRFHTIAYDRRGYHRSAPGRFPPRRDFHRRHGADLLALIDKLRLAPALVVGWSAGAFAALHAALARPAAIRGLVLYEPPLHVATHRTWPVLRTFAAIGWHKLRGDRRRAAAAFLRMAGAYADRRNSMDTLPETLRASMARDIPALLAELEAGTGEELTAARLADLRVPVALLQGERSPPVFARAIERTRAIFPAAPRVQIAGANHFALIDDPAAFAQSLALALAAVAPRV